MKNIEKYLKKRNIEVEHILWAHCEKQHNIIIRLDGDEEVRCYMLMQELLKVLPEDEFLKVRKGSVIRKSGIISISDDGVYTMIDGTTFQGVKRSLKKHKVMREKLGLNRWHSGVEAALPMKPLTLLEKCSILDDMPVAYCIIELVFDENGHGLDFIFRYCNKQMEVIEGVPVEDMVDHSFYEVFKNGDRKWIVSYADVALNGGQRTLHDYSPEVDKTLTIHCYQPEPGYCACVLTEDGDADICPKE